MGRLPGTSDDEVALRYSNVKVLLCQERCTLRITRTGQTWVAQGSFRGKPITVEGNSDSEALENWRSTAIGSLSEVQQ